MFILATFLVLQERKHLQKLVNGINIDTSIRTIHCDKYIPAKKQIVCMIIKNLLEKTFPVACIIQLSHMFDINDVSAFKKNNVS